MSLPPPRKTLRAIGFDDAPFERRRGAVAHVAGIVCAGTRFEGMVWGKLQVDGWRATDTLCRLLEGGKFLEQLHLVLVDGITLGGFNVVDLPLLARRLGLPCVAVMRRRPDMPAVERALRRLPHAERRLEILRRAGPFHHHPPFTFQVHGATPEAIGPALARITDRGNVPEPLRLAHLIGTAVERGESGKRA
ncbi:DUF99 family protein [Vulgatibacter sp.]|uniref:endonuclease dU n=1 Tax=Vulgatibacter sp. TaxID=1971226 RepID=UPI0035643E65